MTHRRKDWEKRLVAFVETNRDKPHEYGKQDCILTPLTLVRELTGKDFARGHRGKYKGQTGALRYLKAQGFDTPEAALDSVLEQKPVGFAQRGDIVLAEDGISAICMGGFALSVGQEGNAEGFVRVPREQWVKAWAVGEQHATYPKPRKRGDK